MTQNYLTFDEFSATTDELDNHDAFLRSKFQDAIDPVLEYFNKGDLFNTMLLDIESGRCAIDELKRE